MNPDTDQEAYSPTRDARLRADYDALRSHLEDAEETLGIISEMATLGGDEQIAAQIREYAARHPRPEESQLIP